MKTKKPKMMIDVSLNKIDDVLIILLKEKLDILVTELNQSLGIPAEVLIAVTTSTTDLIKVSIDNFECQYPDTLIEEVYAFIQNNNTPLSKNFFSTKQGLTRNTEVKLPEGEQENAAQLYSLIALEIIKRYPSHLLGPDQFKSYWSTLKIKEEYKNMDASIMELLHKCFQEVLNMRISISKAPEVSILINAFAFIDEKKIIALQEALIETLIADKVIIEINRDYFESVTTSQPALSGPGLFGLLRDDLYYELGMHFPGFILDFSKGIPHGNFRFKINHISSPPISGIQVDQYLVDATINRMKQLNIEGTPLVHPSNGLECTIVSKTNKEIVEREGIKIWDATGYIAMCLKAALQDSADCFVTNEFIRQRLDRFASGWPQMVETLKQEVDFEILTQTFRSLVRENISIRDFRSIIEAILEQDYIETDPIKYMVLDERLPLMQGTIQNAAENTIKFIRKRIKENLLNHYAWGAINLHVYQLGKRTEQILQKSKMQNQPVSADQAAEILKALKKVVIENQKTHPYAVVLTYNPISSILRKLVSQSLPRLQIITYSELLPKTQIITLAHLP